MAIQMTNYADHAHLLHDRISAFRKGHSTTTALMGVRDDIRYAMKRKEVTLMALADFSKAFDTIYPSIIAIHEKNKATDAPLCFNFEHINQAQVERALLDVNVRKSCGHDMLSPRLVKESASVIAKPITNILNTSIEQGCFPNAWKMGQVTPLFKKDDESNKANYRPVTVLPVLNNIYERLLAAQLGEFYSAILSDFISSYRKFYSCETALLRLTEDWRRMRDRGELVAIVSMDLSKAFDVIQHDLLLAKLKASGVGEGSCLLQRGGHQKRSSTRERYRTNVFQYIY